MPAAERARFYRDPAWRERARADTVAAVARRAVDKVFVQETATHPELVDGPSLARTGRRSAACDPLDVLCDVALDDDLPPGSGS